MSKKYFYDVIFSLGEACSCAQSLTKSDLRLYSCPFDWIWGADFLGRINILYLILNVL